MKKNGFTLMELLAVLVILGMLIILAIPAATRVLNQSKKELSDYNINLLKEAGKSYAYDLDTGIASYNGKTGYDLKSDLKNGINVSVEFLVNKGYFNEGCSYSNVKGSNCTIENKNCELKISITTEQKNGYDVTKEYKAEIVNVNDCK